MKVVIPWLFVVLLLGAVYFLYSATREREMELANQRQELAEVDKLRAENEELKKQAGQGDELARLRKENEDLTRLRGEAQRLKTENKQLTTQLSAAQSQMQGAQAAQQQLSAQLATQNEALRNQSQKLQEAQTADLVQQQTDACVNNLRMLDGAKQQWALENKKGPSDVPTMTDILPYLGRGTAGPAPLCPGGGTYNLNAVDQPPTCTVPGHALK